MERTPRITSIALAALFAVVATMTACSKSSEPAAAPASPVASVPTAADCVDLTADNPFTVTIKNFAFHPSCVTAKSTAAITVVNQDTTDHTFTIDGTSIDVPIAAGQTFNGESANLAPGTYEFHCTIHPTMTGTINVT